MLFSDLRFAARQLLKRPGTTLTALLSLALGIGATTAVFSVIYAALINPYPYPNADRIVRLMLFNKAGRRQGVEFTGAQVQQLRQVRSIDSILALDFHSMIMTGGDVPENVAATGLISNSFDDLGLPAMIGRGIARSDAANEQEPQPVVVLSYKFWQKRFLSDPSVVGKKLQLDHRNYDIIGVAAPRFTWYSADVWIPMKLSPDPGQSCVVNVRLRPGVTPETANAELQPLVEQFARELPQRYPDSFKVHVEGLNDWVIRGISGTLYLLLGAVALLLAIGCGNVSILLLAQGAARQHEFAVRAAVGAHRRRLLRQLLTESTLLAAVGVTAGVLASYGILEAIRTVLPRFAFAPEVVIRINLPVLAFSGAVAAITVLLFGLWPAMQLSRMGVAQIIVSGARRVAGSVRGKRTHNALIAAQIALTLVLLAGAGSAMQSFLQLVHTPLGYDPNNIMSVGLPIHEGSYTTWAARSAYIERLRAKVAVTPGVIMAAISSNATPPRSGGSYGLEILGVPPVEQQTASVHLVDPGYFPALRIPLLEGRIWDEFENRRGAPVAVINQTFARRYFPNGGAIGHSIKLPRAFENHPPNVVASPAIEGAWLPIVGIIADVKNDGLGKPIVPAVYVPYTTHIYSGTQILVRAQTSPLALMNSIRRQLASVDPDQQAWGNIDDLETWITNQAEWQQEHLAAWIFGAFAVLALALAAIGLYSVVSYTVTQRTSEFGIRMALGAHRTHVLRIVFGSTAGAVGGGILLGFALTIAVNKSNPMLLLAAATVLAFVATLACAIPAWQAAKVDPMTALRSE
jgi:predicted permease